MDSQKAKINISGTVFVIIAVLSWVPGPVIIKYLTNYVDFWTQNLLRYTTAMIMFLPILVFSIKTRKVDSSIWRKALLPAIPNISAQCLWASALYYINPAFMTLLSQSQLLWTMAISMALFADERPLLGNRRFLFGTLTAIIGLVGVITLKHDFTARASVIGIVISLGWAINWSLYSVAAKTALKNIDSAAGFAVISIYTTVPLAILAFIFGHVGQCTSMSSSAWIYLIISGISSIAISHSCYYAAIKRMGATIPSLAVLAQPFLILLVSHILFNETLSPAQWLFGIILIAGAAIAVLAREHLKK
ncbi:MAG: DMT family transporter [Phycisphaerae bacterium]|nr:DMT family transporter [Phycisphaerae bacterium]